MRKPNVHRIRGTQGWIYLTDPVTSPDEAWKLAQALAQRARWQKWADTIMDVVTIGVMWPVLYLTMLRFLTDLLQGK